MFKRLISRCKQYGTGVSNLGLAPSFFYKVQVARERYCNLRSPFHLYSKYAQFPLLCRPKTSDINVFDQIFIAREYRCLDHIRDAEFIIDCGANVGYSAAYFLTRFQNATLIAVEPDKENFDLLIRNLDPYKPRIKAIHSAIWSHPTSLVFEENSMGYRREWARTLREAEQDEIPVLTAIDVCGLIDGSGFDRIDILKVDIEGAEAIVFGAGYERWVNKIENLVIELHGENCSRIVHKALAGLNYKVSECDELTVFCKS